jgi:hypothetical protein
MSRQQYNIYATLLDAFQGWLSSSEIYQEYWGFSEEPAKTEEEFEQEQLQSLLDRINRVPFDSEAADKGTAFNEVVDCIIEHRISHKMDITSNPATGTITAVYNNRTFVFPTSACVECAKYYKGAATQVYTDAVLNTKYGDVLLYGFIDELMPESVHDIKTTSKYKAGKFRNNWQHIVYPYCLNNNGNKVNDFEYNVVVLNGMNYSTFTELYTYQPERDIRRLTEHVELLIEFLMANRDKITDKKIFNQHENV